MAFGTWLTEIYSWLRFAGGPKGDSVLSLTRSSWSKEWLTPGPHLFFGGQIETVNVPGAEGGTTQRVYG